MNKQTKQMTKEQRVALVKKLLDSGLNTVETAKKMGMKVQTVQRYIKEENIEYERHQDSVYKRVIRPHLKEVEHWLIVDDFEKKYVCEMLGIKVADFDRVEWIEKPPEFIKILKKWRRKKRKRLKAGIKASYTQRKLNQALYYLRSPKLVSVETQNPELFVGFVQMCEKEGLRVKKLYPRYNGDKYIQDKTYKIRALLNSKEYDIICALNLTMMPQMELAFEEGKSKPLLYKMWNEFENEMCVVYIVDKNDKYNKGFKDNGRTRHGLIPNPKRDYLSQLYRSFDGLKYAINQDQYERTAKGIRLAYEKGLF